MARRASAATCGHSPAECSGGIRAAMGAWGRVNHRSECIRWTAGRSRQKKRDGAGVPFEHRLDWAAPRFFPRLHGWRQFGRPLASRAPRGGAVALARMCRRAARHGSTMKTRDRSRRREEQRRRMAAAHSVGMQSVADSGWTQGPQRRNGWNAGGRKDHAPPNGQPPLLRTNSSTSGWRSYDRALRPKRPQPTAEFRGLEDRCRATSMTLMGRLPHYLSLGCCGERRIDRTLCVRRCSWARGALEHRVVGYHQDGCTTLHEGAADCPRREWVGCRLPGDRITVSVLVAREQVRATHARSEPDSDEIASQRVALTEAHEIPSKGARISAYNAGRLASGGATVAQIAAIGATAVQSEIYACPLLEYLGGSWSGLDPELQEISGKPLDLRPDLSQV